MNENLEKEITKLEDKYVYVPFLNGILLTVRVPLPLKV